MILRATPSRRLGLGNRNIAKNCVILLILALAFSICPVAGQFQGAFDLSDPIGLLAQTGILRFNSFSLFFSDIANLFFGKRRLLCGLKAINMQNAATGPNFQGNYRSSSHMVLPQAGFYVGEDSILEYISFTNTDSPYVAEGPKTAASQITVVGYDDSTGECEYSWRAINRYTMEESMVGGELHFAHTALLKLFLDYDDVTNIRRVHVYFPPPFLAWFFTQLHTQAVADFMCDTVLSDPGCIAQLGGPPVASCATDLLTAFPLTTAGGYVDGPSFGCKLLHASFARTNFQHCAHVSLDPVDLDPNGLPVCSRSLELPEDRFFTADDTAALAAFGLTDGGIDPSVGYTILSTFDAPLPVPSA